MNPQIAALIELQSIDQKILRLRENQEESPRALADAEREVARRQDLLDLKLAEIKDLQVKISLKEDDLKDHEVRIDKLKAQQAAKGIKNKEFQVLGHEIEGEKANASYLQEIILQMMSSLENAQKEAEQLHKEVDGARGLLANQRAAVDKELALIRQELQTQEAKRAVSSQGFEKEILSRYERILKGKKNFALAEVVDNHCQGCFMSLTPQMAMSLRRGAEIIICQSCGRLLYLP